MADKEFRYRCHECRGYLDFTVGKRGQAEPTEAEAGTVFSSLIWYRLYRFFNGISIKNLGGLDSPCGDSGRTHLQWGGHIYDTESSFGTAMENRRHQSRELAAAYELQRKQDRISAATLKAGDHPESYYN